MPSTPASAEDTDCRLCGAKVTTEKRGPDIWVVHVTSGKARCTPGPGCRVATSRHILADGTPCPDQRHRAN